MKNLLLALCLSVALTSCGVRVISLKGKYQEQSVKSKYSESFEQIWESVIDLIAEEGLSVKMIDKSSGLIIADEASFFGLTSTENDKGQLINEKAFIATERLSTDFPSSMNNYFTTAKWNLRVKGLSNSETIVSVNLHSIRIDKAAMPLTGKSTGNFEKWLLDSIGK